MSHWDFPANIPQDGNGWLTVSGTFSTPSERVSGQTWLSFGALDFPCEVRFNGDLVYLRGTFPPGNAWVQMSQAALFPIPERLWAPAGQPNHVVLRLFEPGPRVSFPSPAVVADRRYVDFQQNVVQLLNKDFYFLFFGVNFVGGLYFLAVWAGRKEDLTRLYFALSSLFIALYFFEMGSPVPLFPGSAYRGLMKACLSWSIGFALLFFLEYFPLYRARWLKASVAAVFALAGVWVALGPDNPTVMDRFTLALLPLQGAIVFIVFLLVRSWRRGSSDAVTIFAGTVIAVVLGTHDVVYQVQGRVPVAWLQGLGFFAFQGSMFLSLALQSSRLYREVAETNRAFARFVPREFLAFLGKKSITDVALGDQVQQDMAILFSDIRDFTALSESLSPTQNFNLLNAYLNRMVPEVRKHGGIVDKYIGDAIMALYAAGAEGALRSALAMRDSLTAYNSGRARAGYDPLEMGIGIHCGSLMLGTIGDEDRMDSTVISDVVNTAARIQGLTKVFGLPIIVSQSALDEVPFFLPFLEVRYLGTLPVRGRSGRLGLSELIHPADPWRASKLRHRAAFEEGVRAWEQGGRKALGKLMAYRDEFPEDPALDYFLDSD